MIIIDRADNKHFINLKKILAADIGYADKTLRLYLAGHSLIISLGSIKEAEDILSEISTICDTIYIPNLLSKDND